MARRFLAPQHRADAPSKFIVADDTAWNAEAISKALDGDTDLAPLRRYLDGTTRYDLGAADFAEANEAHGFIALEDAEVWTLRALPVEYRIECLDLQRRGAYAAAYTLAFTHGVIRVEGALGDAGQALADYIEQLPERRTHRHATKLLELVDAYAYSVVLDVGRAVITACDEQLSEAEGKR